MARFIHLSDIHFSIRAPSIGFDPDRDVRHEVIRDIRDQVTESGSADAILVSGDIAYSGKKAEYDDATEWLDEVCSAAGCSSSSVYVCPGNHDVDRSVLLSNGIIQDVQDAIRKKGSWFESDSQLLRRLQEPAGARMLFQPIDEFNEFAARYECSFFSNGGFAWDKDFPLNDGSILRLRGMNSALLSGPYDEIGSLCLGSRAWTLHRQDGIEYMVMCHHPPSWLMDGNEAQTSFEAKSRIQLFGHEHDQRIWPGRDSVRLFAGSINPHRAEPNWRPGYNIIDVSIESEGADRQMLIDVRMREWSRQPFRFQELRNIRGDAVDRSRIQLSPWTRSNTWSTPPSPSQEVAMVTPAAASPSTSTRPVREVINQFFRLTVSQKNEIAGRLSLFEEAERSLPDFERYKRALTRARDGGKWSELENMLNSMEEKR